MTTDPAVEVKKKTDKSLGFWMATALVVGNMIGSGVFLLPAALAPFGWSAVAGWVLTIAGGICLAGVFAALAGAFPRAGGPYAYAREAFGPAPAFMVAWSYWISIWVGNAAVATGAVSYLSVFFPQIAETTGLHAVVTCGAIWLLTAVNCRGAFLAGSVQLVTTVLKILPLVAAIALGAFVLGGMTDKPASIPEFSGLGDFKLASITAAATLTLWALLGLESATVPAEHVENPGKTIPRATMTGMIIAGVIYLFSCSVVILLLPADEVAASNAPFADFVSTYLNPDAGRLIALFAAISGFGALNGWIMVQGELPYAMAKGGVFPRWLAKESARGLPVRAHVTSSLLLTGVVMLNYSKSMTELFTFIVLLSTTASLFMFLASALSALQLQRVGKLKTSPVLLAAATAAVIYAIWTIYGAGGEAVAWGAALLFAGLPVYWIAHRQNRAAQT
ncbi:amino acid permease [Hyphococcus luteus]|uniref:Arginine/agmatine antiporter n=1 Tax=Hyphococcus luteus TaxID=2058213 RepID=A0A2S7KA31_9PROT|nr:amino acid permease [Marinicaulis flavus]PQA89347.1 amino acid permease [Marinicaulis flavus]